MELTSTPSQVRLFYLKNLCSDCILNVASVFYSRCDPAITDGGFDSRESHPSLAHSIQREGNVPGQWEGLQALLHKYEVAPQRRGENRKELVGLAYTGHPPSPQDKAAIITSPSHSLLNIPPPPVHIVVWVTGAFL